MKNDECVIYFITKGGSKQIWYKNKDKDSKTKGWKQKSGRGIIRKATAEQFLSHLLPALTPAYKDKLTIKVVRKKVKKK
ncbi:MAG: hypothetical protein ACP5NZ_01135 [Nanobdellota archaeon]